MLRRKPISEHLYGLFTAYASIPIAGLAYLIITLVILYPVSLRPRTLLPVHAYDTYEHVWALWWYRYALLNGVFPAQVSHLYAPSGCYIPMLWTWALPLMSGIPLQPLVGLIGTYNLLVILSFLLTALAMYLLAMEVTGSRAGAFFAGLIWAFFPGRTIRLVGHFYLLNTHWMPIYALFLLRLCRRPGWKVALGCGISLALVCLSHMLYAAYFALPITLVILFHKLITDRRTLLGGGMLRAGALAVTVALLIVAPFFAPYLLDYARDPLRFVYEGGDSAYSADLLSFVVPCRFNPLVQRLPWLESYARRIIPPGGNAAESLTYLGWMAILWGVVGIVAHRGKSLLWCMIALMGAVLSLGPVLRVGGQAVMLGYRGAQIPLPLPYAWVSRMPLMAIGRTPARFGITALLAVAVLAAFGLQRLWASGLPKGAKIGLLSISAVLLLTEYLVWWPLQAFPTPVSPFYTELSSIHAPGETAILPFPMFYQRDHHILPGANYGMINQTVHEQRIAGGYLVRWPAREKGHSIGLEHLMAPERGIDIVQYDGEQDIAATLYRLGFDYVVVHKPITEASPPDAVEQARAWAGYLAGSEQARAWAQDGLTSLLGAPIYEDDMLWAWRVPEMRSDDAVSTTYLYAGRGWHDPQRLEERTFRWMQVGESELFVEQPQPGWGILTCDVSARDEGELILSLDGQTLHRWPVGPGWQTISTRPLYLPATSNRLVLHATVPTPPNADYHVQVANVTFKPLSGEGQ
jgi:hypothetical protein